jgi:hypothetical protein
VKTLYKYLIFLIVAGNTAFPATAQTTFLNIDSNPAFWGSCFAVVRKELQAGYAPTQNIGLKAMETISEFGLLFKQYKPEQYAVFIKEADKLNKININSSNQSAFTAAFAECVNAAQKARQK